MFSPYRLINKLEDNVKLIKQAANDQCMSCDKRLEFINDHVSIIEDAFEEYRKVNYKNTFGQNHILEQLKERALDACAEYSVYSIGKEKGINFDSDYEADVHEYVAKVGQEVNVLLLLMSKESEKEDSKADLEHLKTLSDSLETKEGD